MKSVIYQLRQLKRVSNFPFQLDEIGIMVEHCSCVKNKVLDRYFFCFSYNKDKYISTEKNLRPLFSIMPPGTVINSDGKKLHDELFFSYSVSQIEKIRELFNYGDEKYSSFLLLDDEFMQNLLKLKELITMRNTLGVADKLDTLAMHMIMTVYSNSLQNNDNPKNVDVEAKIQEIAIKLKHGEKLNALIRKYGFSRRAFYYEWGKMFSVSPKHIQLEAKLEQAQKLLITTQLSIAEIAEQCEFSSYHYFYECFIKYFNSTPGEYRRRFNWK